MQVVEWIGGVRLGWLVLSRDTIQGLRADLRYPFAHEVPLEHLRAGKHCYQPAVRGRFAILRGQFIAEESPFFSSS